MRCQGVGPSPADELDGGEIEEKEEGKIPTQNKCHTNLTSLYCRSHQWHSLKFGGSKWAFGGDSVAIVIEDRHGKRLG